MWRMFVPWRNGPSTGLKHEIGIILFINMSSTGTRNSPSSGGVLSTFRPRNFFLISSLSEHLIITWLKISKLISTLSRTLFFMMFYFMKNSISIISSDPVSEVIAMFLCRCKRFKILRYPSLSMSNGLKINLSCAIFSSSLWNYAK